MRTITIVAKINTDDYETPLKAYEAVLDALLSVAENIKIEGLDGDSWEDGR